MFFARHFLLIRIFLRAQRCARNDPSSFFSPHGSAKVFIRRDDHFATSCAQEAQCGFNFGTHVAGREVSCIVVLGHFIGSDEFEPALRRLFVVEIDVVGVGRDSDGTPAPSEEGFWLLQP